MVSFSSFIPLLTLLYPSIFNKKAVIKNPHTNSYKSHIKGAWGTCGSLGHDLSVDIFAKLRFLNK
jgi:hypothetical protein